MRPTLRRADPYLERAFYSAGVEWVRRWEYQIQWAPGHSGVHSRHVDTVGQLRAVVAWARHNTHVQQFRYKLVYDLEGERASVCSRGHALQPPVYWQAQHRGRYMVLFGCPDCPGHYVTDCPTCAEQVCDPPLGLDCDLVTNSS